MEKNNFVDVEIYTEKLNDIYARISEFIAKHPKKMIHQLLNQQHYPFG